MNTNIDVEVDNNFPVILNLLAQAKQAWDEHDTYLYETLILEAGALCARE